ncbi:MULTISPECIES: hypothetical protein [Bradyrhizobium]|jgi:hypothetical protein|uniref:hypothetical protein n=1 Tax=Bradyrhizobium TaxID=374 RepID=UPI0004636720|nr:MULTISPECIES: hypothetical protein [Bradyrhizobium]KIU51426.1 hypothetical protein QU41_05360 [Bradyrhizobium elkanii]OCX31526.1 hypothetical protein QU42_09450 [Bradyrhizobium sp. UASWS1016]
MDLLASEFFLLRPVAEEIQVDDGVTASDIQRDANLLRIEAEVGGGSKYRMDREVDSRPSIASPVDTADSICALRRTMNEEIVGSEAFRTETNDKSSKHRPE